MEAEIKRIAQLLFDNAEYLAKELDISNDYRHFNVDFAIHKYPEGNNSISCSVWMGALNGVSVRLSDKLFEIENVKREWLKIDQASGIVPMPEEIVTREKL